MNNRDWETDSAPVCSAAYSKWRSSKAAAIDPLSDGGCDLTSNEGHGYVRPTYRPSVATKGNRSIMNRFKQTGGPRCSRPISIPNCPKAGSAQ